MSGHVCPVWMGYFLASPVRRLLGPPEAMLRPYVAEGMTALDAGCAMGYFSLPLARLVGPSGRVVCVDLQARMLEKLRQRAEKAGLADRIDTRLCRADSLCLEGLEGQADFVLASAVVHETPSAEAFFGQLATALKPGGRLLVAEPRGHVGRRAFEATVRAAEANGLREVERPRVAWSRAVLMDRHVQAI